MSVTKRAGILIRPGTSSDIDAIVRVTNAAYVVERELVAGERTDAAQLMALYSEGGFFVACPADDLGTVVGAVHWKVTGKRGYFGLLAVSPDWQGLGISRQLVRAVEAYCRQEGCSFLDLTVISARKQLFHFYRHLEFSSYDVEPYYAPQKQLVPFRLVRMTKALRDDTEL